jgi:murein DD-endopeptidase MepM/ murein hydrolase activator NlpD
MITRKVNQKTFAWDPTAFRGKGYWFVSGKEGSFGRAASKAEAVALGKPKDEAANVKLPAEAKPQKDISEGTKDGFGKMQEKFGMGNIAKVLGKMKIMKPFSFLGGKKGDEQIKALKSSSNRKLGNVDTAFYATVEEGKIKRLTKGDSVTDVAVKLASLVQLSYEKKKLAGQLAKNFEKELFNEDKRRHQELINIIKNNKIKEKTKTDKKIKKSATKEGEATTPSQTTTLANVPKNTITPKTTSLTTRGIAVGAGVAVAAVGVGVLSKVGASESQGNYNVMNAVAGEYKNKTNEIKAGNASYTGEGSYSKNLTDMTIGEVIQLGKDRKSKFGGGGAAAGKYQFMPVTLQEQAQKVFGKDWANTKFSPENQEKLQNNLLEYQKKQLTSRGVEPSEAAIYMVHFLGNGGAAKMVLDPSNDDKKMGELFSRLNNSNNDTIAKMTVAQYKDSLAKKGFGFGPMQESQGTTAVASAPSTPPTSVAATNVGKAPTGVRITSGFGSRTLNGVTKDHEGIDVAAPIGTPIFATDSGVVVKAGWENPNDPKKGYGQRIRIKHDDGSESVYAHLSQINVKLGSTIEKGTEIAKSGNTGRSTGPHLHYELIKNGSKINPGNQMALAAVSPSSASSKLDVLLAENQGLKLAGSPTTYTNNSSKTTKVGNKSQQRTLAAKDLLDYPAFVESTIG